jgi:hypothetical protein
MPSTSSSSTASAVVDLRERQLLAEPVALPFVARRVDALRKQEHLAKRVKQQLIADGHTKVAPEALDRWERLFVALQEARTKADAAVV